MKMRTELHLRRDITITSTWQSVTDEDFDSIKDMLLDRLQNGTGVIAVLTQVGAIEREAYVLVPRIDYVIVETQPNGDE